MIDDITEEAAKGFFRIIGRFLFTLFVEGLLFYTGEIIIFFVTLGYKKPRWDYYALEKPSKFVVLTELSIFVGFATWLLIAWFVNTKIL